MSSTTWNEVESHADIDHLMEVFGHFHDGCLREAHIWTETSVGSDLNMACAFDLDTRVRLLVQRQYDAPSAIELLFEEVIELHVHPSPPNYDSIIFDATMLLDGGIFYWADSGGWLRADANRNEATWIAARKVSWRDASDWMGEELRYGPAKP